MRVGHAGLLDDAGGWLQCGLWRRRDGTVLDWHCHPGCGRMLRHLRYDWRSADFLEGTHVEQQQTSTLAAMPAMA